MSSIKNQPEDRSFRLPRGLEILFGVIIVLELVAPFATKMYGIDARFHLLWIGQYASLMEHGILIPTWVPAGFGGFGSITFYFYPPLTYLLASTIALFSGVANSAVAYQSVSVLATLGSFVTARRLLHKLHAPHYQSTVGALIYAFAPLRLFEIYNRGDLSTHVSYVVLPLICLAVIDIYCPPQNFLPKRVIALGVLMAILLLTNVPIALAVTICLGIILLVTWRNQSRRSSFELFAATILAAALTFYHYSSVLSARRYALLSLFTFKHSPGDIALWFHLGAGTYNVVLLYALAAIALWAYWKSPRSNQPLSLFERRNARIGLVLTIVVLFLDFSPLSYWLWNTWLLRLIQIPWRFYPELILFISLAVGLASTPAMQRAARKIVWICVLAAVPPLGIILSSWHSIPRLPAEDEAYKPIFATAAIDKANWNTEDTASFRSLSNAVPLPRMFNSPYEVQYGISQSEPRLITFHRFYWPFWHLYANGREIPSHPDSLGRAVATLPAGIYTATWRLERTPLETAGLWISGFSWAGVLIFFGIGLARRRVRMGTSPSP